MKLWSSFVQRSFCHFCHQNWKQVAWPRSSHPPGKRCQYLHDWSQKRESRPLMNTRCQIFIGVASELFVLKASCILSISFKIFQYFVETKSVANSGMLPFPQKAEQVSTNSPIESVVSTLLQKSSWWNSGNGSLFGQRGTVQTAYVAATNIPCIQENARKLLALDLSKLLCLLLRSETPSGQLILYPWFSQESKSFSFNKTSTWWTSNNFDLYLTYLSQNQRLEYNRTFGHPHMCTRADMKFAALEDGAAWAVRQKMVKSPDLACRILYFLCLLLVSPVLKKTQKHRA